MVWHLRDYSLPLVFAVALHAAALFALINTWHPERDSVRTIRPQIVNSTLLVLEPKAKPKPATQAPAKAAPPAQKQAPPAKPAAAKPATPKPEVAKPAPAQPKPDPQEVIRAQAAEAERRARLQALASSSFLTALESESEDLQAEAAADEAELAQGYRYGIYQRVVSNWSRPPSARNGMQALLQVELVPTGDVVAVMLIESSGNAAFDQSAEAAVRKARRFDVPKESAVFERHFRRFTLLFKPEDLLR